MSDTSRHVDLESQQKVMPSSGARWRRFLLIIKAHRVFVSILTDPPPLISLLGPSAGGGRGGVHGLPPPYISALSSAGINGDVPDESSSAVRDNQASIEVVHLDVEVEDDDDYCSRARDNANLQRANIVKIVKEKDIDSLQSFGGVGGIAEALCTDLELGIHIPGDNEESTSTSPELPYARESAEAAQLSTTQATRGLFRLLKKYCSNCNILLLSLCAALSIGFGIKEEGWKTGWYEGAIITVAIFILILAPSIRDFIRQRRSQRLSETHKPIDETGFVIRGGCRKELSISNIVVGDVVCLTSGSPIPGDGLFIVSDNEVLVIEDGLESTVDEKSPFLFYGAKVVNGSGRMLITSVGMETVLGEMMSKVSNTHSKNPLPAQLEKVGTTTQIAGLSISVLILVVLFLHFMLESKHTNDKKHSAGLPELKNTAATKGIIDIIKKIVTEPCGKISPFTASLAILLIGVQEQIPFVIILAMAYRRKRMFSRKEAYVQELLASVTIGSAKFICVEKLYQPQVSICYVGEEKIQKHCWFSGSVASCVREALCQCISTPILMPSIPGGFALLSEPPTDELMNNPPISPTEPFIPKSMWRNIATQTLYQTSILVTFHFKGKNLLGIGEQVSFNEISHILVDCARLNKAQWVLCLIMGFISVPIDSAVKLTTSFIKIHAFLPQTGSTSFTSSVPAYSESSVSSILELSQQGNTPNQP
ncbi:hypothetical protein FEM48_Zijuj01G0083700 [Ziziphus jujuba var. spinosa]|uniref:Calcium-transporting ATPase 12, plasma membrane-type-like n=1 Tax=Ziziphus jujuba var. spinosa TaxID=714518 RepID=A0A978W060_ZIZJJ|nr:hypothetical protein FEM48_Zijuj01G0083700 [Ziziphus jujuba var. spinosa]